MQINRGGLSLLRITKNVKGYTIVEVMIFLAVSTAIFVSAVGLVSGQQGRTQFQQAMRDIESKLQTSISEVKTGVYPNSGNSQCTVGPTFSITLSAGTTEQGANEDCLYLGKAFHAIGSNNSYDNKLYIYTVLGSREYSPGGASRALATRFDQTSPQAIPSLTEEYEMPYGTKIVYSKIATGASAPNNNLVGFFQSLENESLADTSVTNSNNQTVLINGSQSIFARAYSSALLNNPTATNATGCIQGSAACNMSTMSTWYLCVQSATSSQTGLITVTSTVAGVSTSMEIKACP